MIDKSFDLEKKKLREQSANKRLTIKKKINIDNFYFYNILNQHTWFKESKVIASFLSIKSEISTNNINNFFKISGKVLCLPVMVDNSYPPLLFKKYSLNDNLVIGKFGVSEPHVTKTYLPDIIFTPCLAFDRLGNRLGYGGGYYDKTISYYKSINHKFLAVGLAYDDQKVDKVVHDNFDQKLNYILTEKQLYKIL